MKLGMKITVACCAVCLATVGWLFYGLQPVSYAFNARSARLEIKPGESFLTIARELAQNNLIRSLPAFITYAVTTGEARALKPGPYELHTGLSGPQLLQRLIQGPDLEKTVTIPEGSTLQDIDRILSQKGVLAPGELIGWAASGSVPVAGLPAQAGKPFQAVQGKPFNSVQGKLFPDTYKFFISAQVAEVAAKFLGNFKLKASPLLAKDPDHAEQNLILAAILEKEVPDYQDRRVVAGILKKRLAENIPLQVDATVCYLKKVDQTPPRECYPLTDLDLKIDSPYNTYLYAGWPPGPINNPGASAIQAAVNSEDSGYWYYLSNPRTGKTVFARTLAEQEKNRALYLK